MFRDPIWFAAMPLLIAAAWVAWRRHRPDVRFPTTEGLDRVAAHSRPRWTRLPLILRVATLVFIVVGLARPQHGVTQSRVTTEGIDIVLAVDVSGSMLAEDFQRQGHRSNRLDVVKDVVKEFVTHRPNDRIGLIIFAGRPYTMCPLTLDHGWLLTQLERVRIGMVEDGTAIGSGIATALNGLRRSTAKSRVIILLTDGVNNAGTVTPDAAAQLAKMLGVRIYAIGAGTKGLAPFPATDMFGRRVYQSVKIEVDDAGLTRIAQAAGGAYFRATDTDSLRAIYHQIDAMERTTLEQPKFLIYHEHYPWLIVPALLLLLIEVVVSQTWLRVLP